MAVDTLGHLLALHVTFAELMHQVQQMTGESVEVAFVDQGYTGAQAAADAEAAHSTGSGETAGGKERLCVAASALGR